jgi:hypothetical protein
MMYYVLKVKRSIFMEKVYFGNLINIVIMPT